MRKIPSKSLETTVCAILVWIAAVFSGICVANHHHGAKLTLTPSSAEVIHYVNDSHIVTCTSGNMTRVRWMNPKNAVVDDKRGRVHVEEMSDGAIRLVFEMITLEDKGDWRCQGEANDLEKSFLMIINEPISFVDTPIVQSAREERDAMIRCMVKGDPEPTVSWYYNGQLLSPPSAKYTKVADGLVVKKVSKNDSGEYTCKAFQSSTSISNFKEQTIRLNIQHRPIAPHKASAVITFGYIRGVVNLTCEAEAEPAANFTWSRDNKRLSNKVHMIHTAGHVSKLQVIVNDSNAFGDYKCQAQNSLGTLDRTISLQEGVKPEKPKTVGLRGSSSDAFDVDVGATRGSKQHEVMDINGYRFEVISLSDYRVSGGKWDTSRVLEVPFGEGVTYLISNLTPNTTYLLRVASKNPAGLSDWTTPIEVKTHAREPFGLPPSGTAARMVASSTALIVFTSLMVELSQVMSLDRWTHNTRWGQSPSI